MAQPLSIAELEELVVDRARGFDRDVTPDFVHVYEDPHSESGKTLVVEIATNRPDDRKNWAKQRLRLSQQIRDLLIEKGDDRYPVLIVFGRDEWPKRDD